MSADDVPMDWDKLKQQMEKLRFNSVFPLYTRSTYEFVKPSKSGRFHDSSASQGLYPVRCEKPETKAYRTVWDVKSASVKQLALSEAANQYLEEVIQKLRLELSRLDAIRRHKVRKTAVCVVPTKKSNLSGALRTGKPGLHKQKLLAKKRSFSKGESIFAESNLKVLDWPKL